MKVKYESPMIWKMRNVRIPTRCACNCGLMSGSGGGLI